MLKLIMSILAVVLVMLIIRTLNKRESFENSSPQPMVKWRNPVSAKEHLVLFAAMAEAVTAHDDGIIRLSVCHCPTSRQPGMVESVSLKFISAYYLSSYEESAPGKYLKSLVKENNVAECSFSFSKAEGGIPRCFHSIQSVLEYIRPFAPHAYIENEVIIGFRPHNLDDLPKEYVNFEEVRPLNGSDAMRALLERVIVRHYDS